MVHSSKVQGLAHLQGRLKNMHLFREFTVDLCIEIHTYAALYCKIPKKQQQTIEQNNDGKQITSKKTNDRKK